MGDNGRMMFGIAAVVLIVAMVGGGIVYVLRDEPAKSVAEVAREDKERHQRNAGIAASVGAIEAYHAWRAAKREKAEREGK